MSTQKTWQATRLPPEEDGEIWELFHENSKTGRYDIFPDNDFVVATMEKMEESIGLDSYPATALPKHRASLDLPLQEVLRRRVSARNMAPIQLSLSDLATILHGAYGSTRSNEGTAFVRPFRSVPSGGGLYPLEILFHSAHVKELEAGFYHYNPSESNLRLLKRGDFTNEISQVMVQSEIARRAALIYFIAAIFPRSTFKYGNRGYRFVLIEAGHVAQNINLVSAALNLGCLNIGGFFDREVDRLLGFDGVTCSTVYMGAMGKNLDA